MVLLLGDQLAALKCPAFLRPPSGEALRALTLRRPLVLWLHAVYADPRVRLAEDEAWARTEPSDSDLERWLCSLGVVSGDTLLAPEIEAGRALELLQLAVDGVHGRILLEERGDAACLAESMGILGDMAANQASIFDSQCQILPLSIQMRAAGSVDVEQHSRQLAEDIQALGRQGEALRNRITTARDRMSALRGGSDPATNPSESSTLSRELAEHLNDSLALMERVNAMLTDDAASWAAPTQPHLVRLGETARMSSNRLDSLLQFLRNTETLVDLARSRSSKEQAADVLAHCQDAVDAAAPELRARLSALEASLQLRAPLQLGVQAE